MEPREAIEIIKRMFKGAPTTDQLIALDMAYEALEKQQASEERRNVADGIGYYPYCGSHLN